jgi:thiamine-monophosphate kinase
LAATGGDDYALLAALPPELTPAFTSSKETSVNVVCVGELTKDGAFQLVDDLGPVPLPDRLGYEHNPS